MPWPPRDIHTEIRSGVTWNEFLDYIGHNNPGWMNVMKPVFDDRETKVEIRRLLTTHGVFPSITSDRYSHGNNWKHLSHLGEPHDIDPYIPPDPNQMVQDLNYVRCPDPTQVPAYYEIGRDLLSSKCEVIHMLFACLNPTKRKPN